MNVWFSPVREVVTNFFSVEKDLERGDANRSTGSMGWNRGVAGVTLSSALSSRVESVGVEVPGGRRWKHQWTGDGNGADGPRSPTPDFGGNEAVD